jgi:hypothetical protein
MKPEPQAVWFSARSNTVPVPLREPFPCRMMPPLTRVRRGRMRSVFETLVVMMTVPAAASGSGSTSNHVGPLTRLPGVIEPCDPVPSCVPAITRQEWPARLARPFSAPLCT